MLKNERVSRPAIATVYNNNLVCCMMRPSGVALVIIVLFIIVIIMNHYCRPEAAPGPRTGGVVMHVCPVIMSRCASNNLWMIHKIVQE